MTNANLRNLEPVNNKTLRDKAASKLKSLIVNGDLAPNTRLTEVELSNALQVSRAPLREAIRELVDSGLLVSLPYKGLFVRSVSRKDLEEIYSLRTTLEKLAFEQCWDRRQADDLDRLRHLDELLVESIASSDSLLAIKRELDLHSWCYILSGNRLLLETWERLKPHLHFYFALHQQAHKRSGPLRQAHKRYVDLACGDDLEQMLKHLELHMRQGLEKTIEFIEVSQ